MKKMPKKQFRVERFEERPYGDHKVDQVTTFWDNKCNIIAEYFYYKNKCNYLLSYGFEPDSLGELRKRKAHKAKKPFFSLEKGWYTYVN